MRSNGHAPGDVVLTAFDASTFLGELQVSDQVRYLRCYLADLAAGSVVTEEKYFDRDYLSEFTTYYATSARGYSNACRRKQVFSLALPALRSKFAQALSGDTSAERDLNDAYLGFIVIRPIEATPLGRTVLRWYPEREGQPPRVTAPCREYQAHVAGIRLRVTGLAWQQQDTAVGACATIALWSMLHSSALDEHHSIPTTADITRLANQRWPLAIRSFPASDGLNVFQLCEAIRAQGFQPAVLEADVSLPNGAKGFSPARFAASCSAFIRSGYPVLIGGDYEGGGHAVCAAGFRPGIPVAPTTGQVMEADSALQHVYVHDDNIGPSVRFALRTESASQPIAVLESDPPNPMTALMLPNPTAKTRRLVPATLVVALPHEIRMSTDYLHERALRIAYKFSQVAALVEEKAKITLPGVTFSARFFRLKDYVRSELAQRISGRRLAKARWTLATSVPPMSLHLAVIRIGLGGVPVFDLLYDTTDSQPATGAFAHVIFQPHLPMQWLEAQWIGKRVRGF